ncbi:MAG: TonB-dependent receptor [Candidatus Thiodiazotropha taylori]
MFHKNIYTLSLLLLFGPQVHALHDEKLDHFLSLSLQELMDLEVTISTDTRQTVAKAPSAVTVITEEDIKATGATNLVDILESVPGIHIRANQFGFRPLIQIRGATATQTLLMVNGVSMRDLLWGFGFFWKGMPVSSIERIEIIRGPGSALFGADASAGVINVITKAASKISHNEVGVRSGSFDTDNGWVQYADSLNGVDVGLTMDFYNTDGHDPQIDTDAQSISDRRSGTSASLAADNAQYGWKSEEIRFSAAYSNWRLNLDYAKHDDIETGMTGLGVLDPITKANDKRINADVFYNDSQFHPDWIIDAELRFQDYSYSSGDGFQERPPGALSEANRSGIINQMRSAERRVSAEASGLYSGFQGQSVRLGTGYIWQDLYRVEQYVNFGTGPDGEEIPLGSELVDLSDTPYAFSPEKRRKIYYVFAQDIWQLTNDWELTAGARYDHYSDFGSTFNPRLGLVWQSTDQLTTKLFYGRAFRPPSFQELYASTSNALPNPELKPERSETWELAFSYRLNSNLNFGMNLFHYQQTDLIDDVKAPEDTVGTFTNIGEHTIQGIELEAKWQLANNLRISGNYTIRDQDDSGFRAFDQPEQDAYLRGDWYFLHHWNWNLQFNWIGERERRANDSRATLDDYLIVDTTFRYFPGHNWEFATSIRNLFDEDAREYTNPNIPEGLPLPERNFYAEIRYKFHD